MKNKLRTGGELIPIVILSAFMVLTFSYGTNAAALRAGVSKISITKDKPTEPVNDPLYAKALVLDDGKTRVVIITMDLVNISFADLTAIRTRLRNELKINSNNVMINVSHNHWVNDQLTEDYINRTVKAVKEASMNMVPVKVGDGAGIEKRITMNRRLILSNGKEWTIRRATPEPEDEFVKGLAEPFDPEIGILRLDKTDGKPFAVLFTFAGHNYTGIPNRTATAGVCSV